MGEKVLGRRENWGMNVDDVEKVQESRVRPSGEGSETELLCGEVRLKYCICSE